MSNDFYEVCFVDEILLGNFPTNTSRLVRVIGKLKCYNPISCVCKLVDPERKTLLTLAVNLQHIDHVPFIVESMYQITGNIKDIGEEKILYASTATIVDGLDFQMFKEAIHMRRRFLA